jgi:SnoaL-like domain
MESDDKLAIAELIQSWGVYRDQGQWQNLRETFTPDGQISISWFHGPHEQFVERCKANFVVADTWSRHHFHAPSIRLKGDRAVVETPVIIRVRQKFKHVPIDLTSWSRFLDRVERQPARWRIAERAAIYERDRLDSVEPSEDYSLLFAHGGAARFPEQYRYMAFRLAHTKGRKLAPVVYRDGGPETAELNARFSQWLGDRAP